MKSKKKYTKFLPKNTRLSGDPNLGTFYILNRDADEKYRNILASKKFIHGPMYSHHASGISALSCMKELIANGYNVCVEYEEIGYILRNNAHNEIMDTYNEHMFTTPEALEEFIDNYWFHAETEKYNDWENGELEEIIQKQARKRKVIMEGT